MPIQHRILNQPMPMQGELTQPMIARDLAPLLRRAAATVPVVTLTGPRQSGKTTLCRALFPGHAYRTLAEPDARAFALDDPRGFLRELPDGAVIDEIQRAPNLLSYVQALVDDDPGARSLDSRRLPGPAPPGVHQPIAGRAHGTARTAAAGMGEKSDASRSLLPVSMTRSSPGAIRGSSIRHSIRLPTSASTSARIWSATFERS